MTKPLPAVRPSRAADRAARRQAAAPAPQPVRQQPQEPLVQLPPLSVPVVNLLLEGLGMLPLSRSKPVFDQIEAIAREQVNAFVDAHNAAAKSASKSAPADPAKS